MNVGDGGAFINLNGFSTTISNVLNGTGSGGLTVYATSPGTLTLAGNNTFSGPMQINAGLVDFTVGQFYTGNTNVSGGTLLIDASGTNSGSLGTTNVSVSSGATLVTRGNASISTGNLSVAGGGTLDVRNNAATTNFTINGNLSLGSGTQGSNLYFELGTSSNDTVTATGSAALSGTSTINLSAIVGSSPSVGQYNLIIASGGLSASNFNLNTGPSLKGFDTYSLAATTPTEVILTITGNPTPSTAYWTGKASAALSDSANQWGVGGGINTSNWSTTPDGLTDALQVPGSITDVYFTAANAAGVAGSLTTTLDNNYSIAGLFLAVSSGSITGVTINTGSFALALGGDGLTLAAANASATIGGSGSIVLNAGQSWANNSNSGPLTVTVPISAAGSGFTTLSLNGTGTGGVILSGAISNGPGTLSLSFAQSGTTLLGGSIANSYSGGTTISAGTVKLGGSGALGYAAAPLAINGGVLDLNGFSPTVGMFFGGPGTILNNSGSGVATLTVGQGNSGGGNFSGTIADNDGIHTGGSVALQIVGAGEWTLSGTNTYSGGTTVGAGTTLNLASSSTIGTGILTMNGGNLDNNSGNPVVMGNIPQTWTGGFAYAGGSLLNLGTGPVTVNVPTTINVQQSSGTLEVDGNITSGTSELFTAGAGTVILTGSNNISAVNGANVASFGAANTISTGTTIVSGGNFVLQSGTFSVTAGLVSAAGAVNGVGTVIGNGGSSLSYMIVSGGTFQQVNDLLYIGQHVNGLLDLEGSGVVALGTSPLAFSYNGGLSGTFQFDGGTLQASGFSSPFNVGGQTVNFNGGVLQLTASSANLLSPPADFTANVQNGGMLVNLNGYSSTINRALNGSGSGGLTVFSASGGSLTLTGSDTYTGGTYVEGATLIVTNPAGIQDGTNLFVGNANQLFASVVPSQAASAVSAPAVAPVPEPQTLALAAAAGACLLLNRRRRGHFRREKS